MTDTTSPSGTVDATPLNFHDAVDAIENLLSTDPEMDPGQEDEATKAVEAKSDEAHEADDDDVEIAIDDEQDEPAEASKTAPSTVNDETLVELSDGQKISIGELKRNNLFQRDYTHKTTALSEKEKALEQQFSERVAKAEEEIKARADLVLRLSSELIPQKPVPPADGLQDPVAYLEYVAAKEAYDARIAELSELHNRQEMERQRAEEQQKKSLEELRATEQARLMDKIPKFKDEAKRKAFMEEAIELGAATYGISANDIMSIPDHRMVMILHDAIQYRKAVAKSQQVKENVTAKPRLEQKQRMSAQTIHKRDQQGRFEAVRQSGSINDAAKFIETLID